MHLLPDFNYTTTTTTTTTAVVPPRRTLVHTSTPATAPGEASLHIIHTMMLITRGQSTAAVVVVVGIIDGTSIPGT